MLPNALSAPSDMLLRSYCCYPRQTRRLSYLDWDAHRKQLEGYGLRAKSTSTIKTTALGDSEAMCQCAEDLKYLPTLMISSEVTFEDIVPSG